MEKKEQVVLRYLNGDMEKCLIKPYVSCSLKVIQVIKEDGSVRTIPVKDLKAIFFVKDLEGKDHKEGSWEIEDPEALKIGKRVTVTFKDGEKMKGKILGDWKKGEGFFLYPMEINSNNIKVFIVKTSIVEIKEEE
jgi:hypothetical protein